MISRFSKWYDHLDPLDQVPVLIFVVIPACLAIIGAFIATVYVVLHIAMHQWGGS